MDRDISPLLSYPLNLTHHVSFERDLTSQDWVIVGLFWEYLG